MSNTTKKKLGMLLPLLAALAVIWAVVAGRPGMGQQNARSFDLQEHDRTNFPLQGRHRMTACEECHIKGVFEGTPRTCEHCHWQRRQDDRYQLRLGSSCGDCHTPESWKKLKPNVFNHEMATGFRLEGLHRTLDCAECHGEQGFRSDRIGCYDCHAEDFQEAREPDHVAARFPTQCQICHTNGRGWEANFIHSAFELRGRHREAGCGQCHSTGQYQGLSHECYACHMDDYNGTTDPSHRDLNFPLHCENCHGTESVTWEGAQVNHDIYWPRQGAHRNLNCSACHSRGYDLPTNCYGCHAEDYNSSRNPNHRDTGFPTSCENCHYPTHTSWHQAVFNHAFPIRSGRHSGLDCTECHKTSNYREFSCTECHAHERSEMDSEHHDVGGYSYNSQACFACHPQGRGD